MCLINGGAISRRAFTFTVAVVLCLATTISSVRAQETPAISSAGEPVLLRDQPGYDAAVLATLSDGNPLVVSGEPVSAVDGSSWLPVVVGGQSGFVPAGYVPASAAPVAPTLETDTVPEAMQEPVTSSSMTSEPAPVTAPAPSAAASVAPSTGTATTITDVNLRSGPSADASIVSVLPTGATISVDGLPNNGFAPVTSNGVSGWIAVELLDDDATAVAPVPATTPATDMVPVTVDGSTQDSIVAPAPAPAPATSAPGSEATRTESTGIAWPFSGGTWEVVQGYNNGTHTNRSSFAQYKYSLDWARVDGDTAGQPVFAPVTGTVEWIDRGSGGMLVNAGNGYGVAIFHVTLDRSLSSGGTVERGQRIGTISGPGGDGYMSMAHIDITVWKLAGRGHEAVPFVGPNAIAGQEFPDSGGVNQHMGTTVTP